MAAWPSSTITGCHSCASAPSTPPSRATLRPYTLPPFPCWYVPNFFFRSFSSVPSFSLFLHFRFTPFFLFPFSPFYKVSSPCFSFPLFILYLFPLFFFNFLSIFLFSNLPPSPHLFRFFSLMISSFYFPSPFLLLFTFLFSSLYSFLSSQFSSFPPFAFFSFVPFLFVFRFLFGFTNSSSLPSPSPIPFYFFFLVPLICTPVSVFRSPPFRLPSFLSFLPLPSPFHLPSFPLFLLLLYSPFLSFHGAAPLCPPLPLLAIQMKDIPILSFLTFSPLSLCLCYSFPPSCEVGGEGRGGGGTLGKGGLLVAKGGWAQG